MRLAKSDIRDLMEALLTNGDILIKMDALLTN